MAALAKPWSPAMDYRVYAKTEAESVGQAVVTPSGKVWALFQTRHVMTVRTALPAPARSRVRRGLTILRLTIVSPRWMP